MIRFNEQNFLYDLSHQPWEHVYFYADDSNSMWEIWKKEFINVLDKHPPIRKKKIK